MTQVTVLMSVYNSEISIRQAIESILNQTFDDFEFLIINDGSTDNTSEIIHSYKKTDSRIRLIDNTENIGLTKSLNIGLSLAKGEYIARFDGDDISYPQRLAKQIKYMDINPNVAILGTQAGYIDTKGIRLIKWDIGKPLTSLGSLYYLMFAPPVNHPTVLYRKSIIWNEFGGYNEEFEFAQDWELWTRVGLKYDVVNLNDTLVDIRHDSSSISGLNINCQRKLRHINRWKILSPQIIASILQITNFQQEWCNLWIDLRNSNTCLNKEQYSLLSNGIDSITKYFIDCYEGAKYNIEINNFASEFKMSVILNMVKYSKFQSLIRYVNILIKNRSIAHRYFMKYIALFLMGDNISNIYRYFRTVKRK